MVNLSKHQQKVEFLTNTTYLIVQLTKAQKYPLKFDIEKLLMFMETSLNLFQRLLSFQAGGTKLERLFA